MRLFGKGIQFEVKGGLIDEGKMRDLLLCNLDYSVYRDAMNAMICKYGSGVFDNMYVLKDGNYTKVTSLLSKELRKLGVPNDVVSGLLQKVAGCYSQKDLVSVSFFDKAYLGEGELENGRTCFGRNGCNNHHRKTLQKTHRAFAIGAVGSTMKGRAVGYFLGNHLIFLCNFYEKSGYKSLIRSVLIEGLRRMFGFDKCRYIAVNAYGMPFYYNGDGVVIGFGNVVNIPETIDFDNYYFACETCGSNILRRKGSGDNHFYCETCIDDLPLCYMCRENIVEYEGDLCEECRENCSYCEHHEGYVPNDEAYYVEGYGTYCYDCYHEQFVQCYNCGEDLHIEDDEYITTADTERIYCMRCVDRGRVELFYCEGCERYFEFEIGGNTVYDERSDEDDRCELVLCTSCLDELKTKGEVKECKCGTEFISKYDYCMDCLPEHTCNICGAVVDELIPFEDNLNLCSDCYADRMEMYIAVEVANG